MWKRGELSGGGILGGKITWNGSDSTIRIPLPFRPKRLVWFSGNTTYFTNFFYDVDRDSSHFFGNQATIAITEANSNDQIGSTYYWNSLIELDDDHFTLGHFVASYTGSGIYWFASKD